MNSFHVKFWKWHSLHCFILLNTSGLIQHLENIHIWCLEIKSASKYQHHLLMNCVRPWSILGMPLWYMNASILYSCRLANTFSDASRQARTKSTVKISKFMELGAISFRVEGVFIVQCSRTRERKTIMFSFCLKFSRTTLELQWRPERKGLF